MFPTGPIRNGWNRKEADMTGNLAVVESREPAAPKGDQAASSTVRVLIADGEQLVRAGFRSLLERARQIVVVGEAASGEEVLALARRTRPDVVLIDAALPGLDSIEAISRVCADGGAAVMLLTGSDRDERVIAAVRAGALGLLLRDADPAELLRSVESLARGEVLLSPKLARWLVAELAAQPQPSAPRSELLDELTEREREVVVLVAQGLSNDEIAERLTVTPATAKTHVSRIMAKLDAHDRAKLVVFGYESGLVAPRRGPDATQPHPLSLAL
jgi:DNA-binding NarL/FixJ family response regulator